MPRGFRDLRIASSLLASARGAKDLKFKFAKAASGKLNGLINKVKSGIASAAAALPSVPGIPSLPVPPPSIPLRGAAAAAAGEAGRQLKNAIMGKGGKAISSFSKVAGLVALGARIVEETDAEKIRNPVTEGASISPAQQAKSLAQTAAKGVINGLVTKIPVATGLLPTKKIFSTLAKLKSSPRFFDLSGASSSSSNPAPDTLDIIVTPEKALYPQSGLLEDELAYRLTLLAENIYKPINDFVMNYPNSPYPNGIVILEGFRSQNSGKSLHERGEALDFTLGDGSLENAEKLYELAKLIRDNLIYDQLILCYSLLKGGQTWIHMSFTPDNRRRQVFTKTNNDIFLPGLHLIGQYSSAAARQRDVQKAQEDAQFAASLTSDLDTRSSRLNKIDVNTPEQTVGLPASLSKAKCTIDPFGKPYIPDNSKKDAVLKAVTELLAIPEYLALVQKPDRRESVPFIREVAKRAGVGINAVRGNGSDPSGDAIAILNPTAGKGFGSWDTSKRVQIMDVIINSNTPNPQAAWQDETSVCADDVGGGYIEP